MLHIVEGCKNSRFQRFFVFGDKYVVDAEFFLLNGSAPMLALCIGKGILYGLSQFCVLHFFCLLDPFCFLVISVDYT